MGIVGSGRITPRFLTESKYVSGVNVKSVYDPCNKMIKDYAKKYVLKPYTQDYGAFLKDIDAVYVASTHETHYDYIKRAILNGKERCGMWIMVAPIWNLEAIHCCLFLSLWEWIMKSLIFIVLELKMV